MSDVKHFEVLVIASRRVVIQAYDKEHAEEIAADECTSAEWETEEWRVLKEIKSKKDEEAARRHGAVLQADW